MNQSRKQIPPPRRSTNVRPPTPPPRKHEPKPILVLKSPPPAQVWHRNMARSKSSRVAIFKPCKLIIPSLHPVTPQSMVPSKPLEANTSLISPQAMAQCKGTKVVSPRPDDDNIFFAKYVAQEEAQPIALVANSRTTKQLSHGSIEMGNRKFVEPEPNANKEKEKFVELSSKTKQSNHIIRDPRYVEVTRELKKGRHIPGIVNPSQLVHFLDLHPEYK